MQVFVPSKFLFSSPYIYPHIFSLVKSEPQPLSKIYRVECLDVHGVIQPSTLRSQIELKQEFGFLGCIFFLVFRTPDLSPETRLFHSVFRVQTAQRSKGDANYCADVDEHTCAVANSPNKISFRHQTEERSP